MAALVQTYPQQSGTVTLLQTNPNTSSGIMPGSAQGQPGQQYMGTAQRGGYHVGGGQTTYRGNTTGPVQPYAFTATPSLTSGSQWQQSAPSNASAWSRYQSGSSSTVAPGNATRDAAPRTQSTVWSASAGQPTFAQVAAAKASPERYRRPAPKYTDSSPSIMHHTAQTPGGSAMPSGSGMATVVHLYNPRVVADRKAPTQLAARPHSAYGPMIGASVDDMHVHRHRSEEEVKRFRRRSLHSIDFSNYPSPLTPEQLKLAEESTRSEPSKRNSKIEKDPRSAARLAPPPANDRNATHARNGSSESLVSSRSSNSRPSSSTNRNANASGVSTGSPASSTSTSTEKASAQEHPKLVNIPPRASSSDVGKRVLNPSPLSKPVNMAAESSPGESATAPSPSKPPPASQGNSPAAQQLAAINEKGGKAKSKTSRLRRAFSFGSAAELRKVTGQDEPLQPPQQSEPAKLHKEPRPDNVYEEEQARIAQKQEEGGIGASIYSGTKLFSGSTDNLSISSTASSASIMLRKMGRGVKKGGRSLAGLFRPKSIIGAPASDSSPPETSQATVSMVTVEAERDRSHPNTDQAPQIGSIAISGGLPQFGSNSMEAPKLDSLQSDRLGSSGTDNSTARKSIVGGEKERAEVLATIRKGILKTRSESPSPSTRGTESKGPVFDLPNVPNVSDSPSSSGPSTPNEETHGHRRNGSVAIGSEDYFMSALRLRQETKSAPVTPQGTMSKRNATFSPRIVFYDTWPPGEYDRRGEIATCNRLTPMLAQQIKEELNSFKMEMEVHETSKIYTHFF